MLDVLTILTRTVRLEITKYNLGPRIALEKRGKQENLKIMEQKNSGIWNFLSNYIKLRLQHGTLLCPLSRVGVGLIVPTFLGRGKTCETGTEWQGFRVHATGFSN